MFYLLVRGEGLNLHISLSTETKANYWVGIHFILYHIYHLANYLLVQIYTH